jgi:release factor glutamine methyltransferase
LNKPAHFGISHPEITLSPEEEKKLDSLLDRLLSGEPLPYITGVQEFFGLDFLITPDVLIPRPETELLVNFALNWLQKRKGNNLVADVGSGSGCIAVSIGKNLQAVKIIATDYSFNALMIAQENIKRHNLDKRLNLVQADLLAGLRCRFDCICANLPYIPTEILSNLAVLKFEPVSALDGGQDGLRYIEQLLYQSRSMIKPDGLILLELEANHSQSFSDLATSIFPSASIKIQTDLAGFPRLATIELNDG